MIFSFSWEFHHPNWFIFFRGVGIPTTKQNKEDTTRRSQPSKFSCGDAHPSRRIVGTGNIASDGASMSSYWLLIECRRGPVTYVDICSIYICIYIYICSILWSVIINIIYGDKAIIYIYIYNYIVLLIVNDSPIGCSSCMHTVSKLLISDMFSISHVLGWLIPLDVSHNGFDSSM